MDKYVVLREDLPEVTQSDNRLLVNDEIMHVFKSGGWGAKEHREQGLAYLAVAEYLEGLKPKLPTEPGSVILATKISDWCVAPDGVYLALRKNGVWKNFEGDLGWSEPERIEEWVPVKLVPEIEVCP